MSQFYTPGWHNDPAEVARVVAALPAIQGCPARFADYLDFRADDEKTVLLWEPELRLYGKPKPTWDQGSAGTCVSFGWGRGLNDVYLLMVATGKSSEPPGDVATEPIYGFSRVEIGRGRLGSEDGSLGAWAAEGARRFGNLFRTTYPGGVDLTRYSESLSRNWGVRGVPDSLEPTARVQIARSVAQVRTFDEAWQAIGSYYPVPVCSNRGFTDTLRDGCLDPQGVWNHCMLFRGRLVSRRRGRILICQNSWYAGWLKGDPIIEDRDGKQIELPEGCFGVEEPVADAMLRQDDSFSVSDVEGFPVRDEINWSRIFER